MNAAVDLDELSAVGFGSYRIDVRDPRNRAALELALDSGCNLVDTASNYSNGRSEELIGEVLLSGRRRAFVITKIGYLSPSALQALHGQGVSTERVASPPDGSPYSLDPAILRAVLALSRSRLRTDRLDAVLLHNPEQLLAAGWPAAECEAAIEGALATLEAEVADGRLRFFGVSSNDLPRQDAGRPVSWPSLERLRASLRDRSSFAFLEFPLNVIERDAATADRGTSLLDRTAGQVRRITNRPLNALRNGEVARLAASEPVAAASAWERCVGLVEKQLRATGSEHAWQRYRPMQFLRDNLEGIESQDLCDAVWRSQIQPFLVALFGDPPTDELQRAFDELRDALAWTTRSEIEQRGRAAVDLGTVGDGGTSMAGLAVEACLRLGADHVLVGMRRPAYVAELAPLFSRRSGAYLPQPV